MLLALRLSADTGAAPSRTVEQAWSEERRDVQAGMTELLCRRTCNICRASRFYHEMLHILLVEDNRADVLLVREAIRTSSIDADVLIAYDGWEALRLLTEPNCKPDLIVLDLCVPKLSGFEIVERYRSPRDLSCLRRLPSFGNRR